MINGFLHKSDHERVKWIDIPDGDSVRVIFCIKPFERIFDKESRMVSISPQQVSLIIPKRPPCGFEAWI